MPLDAAQRGGRRFGSDGCDSYRSTRRSSGCSGRQPGTRCRDGDATGTGLRDVSASVPSPSWMQRWRRIGGVDIFVLSPEHLPGHFKIAIRRNRDHGRLGRPRRWIGRTPSGTTSSTAEVQCGGAASEVDLAPSWRRGFDPTGRSGVSPEEPLAYRRRALPIVMGQRVSVAHMAMDPLPVRRCDLLVRGEQDHLVARAREVALHDVAAMGRVQPAERSIDDVWQRPATRARQEPRGWRRPRADVPRRRVAPVGDCGRRVPVVQAPAGPDPTRLP